MDNSNAPLPRSSTLDALIEECAAARDLATFQRLAQGWLPPLLGLAGHYFEQLAQREAVCRDTLLLAWRNLPESNTDTIERAAEESLSQWLYRIFGSVLYNHLLAVHRSENTLLTWLATRHATPITMVSSPTGPRPAPLSAALLAPLAERTTAEPPSQRLQQEVERLIQAEIAQLNAPLTPTGERVYPPLYHPKLRARMFRSRTAFRFKEGFKRCLGRPLEELLFQRWLNNKPGSATLERQGLPRRSVEAHLADKLVIKIHPATLRRGLSFPVSFPDRTQRRKVSNFFLWPGDWDLPTPLLADTPRQHFIDDIWRHRLDLSASDNYARLLKKHQQGQPLRLHHQGILLNSAERILSYLDHYRLYMEDMSCFGFKAELGKDRLGVVIDRNGNLIKSQQGLRRLAMAQTLDIQRVTVRVRAVHQLWWQRQTEGTKGREAIKKVSAALALMQ